jgi:hypothetical protein
MTTLRIVRYQPNHQILYIKDIMQLITNYLQYEDGMKVYRYFKVQEPIRPLIIPNKNLGRGIFGTEFIIGEASFHIDESKLNDIEKWYIPFSSEYKLTCKILEFLNDIIKSNIYLQCGECKEYIELEKKIEKRQVGGVIKNGVGKYVDEEYFKTYIKTYEDKSQEAQVINARRKLIGLEEKVMKSDLLLCPCKWKDEEYEEFWVTIDDFNIYEALQCHYGSEVDHDYDGED